MYELLTIDEIQNNLSKKIKALRLAQNKTQKDFSKDIIFPFKSVKEFISVLDEMRNALVGKYYMPSLAGC